MNMTDPIADLLTRLRNAISARHAFILVPASKTKLAIVRILREEGYIKDFEVVKNQDSPQRMIRVWLNYAPGKEPTITGLDRISRPGQRVYAGKDDLPRVLSGLGIAVVSTPKGIMTDRKARKMGLGGEIVCYVW